MTLDERAEFLSGVIEGFYGQPWTESERMELFDWMAAWGLNTGRSSMRSAAAPGNCVRSWIAWIVWHRSKREGASASPTPIAAGWSLVSRTCSPSGYRRHE